ncbi:hypothetical protein Rsub_07084 [Raphidocelis subcapitata]|uniref:Uncharacterized protein n=1 Tax=Raphidocelis subcapitata TaxID=307507 RepID=A0A2V0PAA2_9CHLO|nr:hypothetical protein Rsub_07084 [Raphidocelis subcapitata]|eukprot:GBF94097.1 hypothetical protein Rsub_07084 [Raphidocelis subcapitata]
MARRRAAVLAALCGVLALSAAARAAEQSAQIFGAPPLLAGGLPSPVALIQARVNEAQANAAARAQAELEARATEAARVQADLQAQAELAAHVRDTLKARARDSAARVEAESASRANAVAARVQGDLASLATMAAAQSAASGLRAQILAHPLASAFSGDSDSSSASASAGVDVSKVSIGGTYPAPEDYTPGVCTGYAFCVPGDIAPTYVPAVATCPEGYNLDENDLCARTFSACLPGFKDSNGKCCADRTSSFCFPSLNTTCAAGAEAAGTICTGSDQYKDVFSKVQVEQVNRPSSVEASGPNRAFFTVRLPRLDLGTNTPLSGPDARIESRLVALKRPPFSAGRLSFDKASLVPKCFTKCCKNDADMMCVPPKPKKEYVEPLLSCPSGCSLPAGGKCICSTGGPAACPAGTTDCTSVGGRVCVSNDLCFGVDSCKVATILMPHLPVVGCPKSSPPLGRNLIASGQTYKTKADADADLEGDSVAAALDALDPEDFGVGSTRK